MLDIKNPSEIKKMRIKELRALAQDLREEIIQTVSEKGGHLASNLGIVELTIALHYVFDFPEDKLVFDVGHQCYAHKLLTGRKEAFAHLREQGGTSGFTMASESEYDAFVAGHASTAISAALGMARTRSVMHGSQNIIAVVGDGALTGGMCYEALNDAGQSKTPLIVVLNDNTMSISKNVGALSGHLTELRQLHAYRWMKKGVRNVFTRIPGIGTPVFRAIESIRDAIKSLLVEDRFFAALGFQYYGPVDGHNIKKLIKVLRYAKNTQQPILLHIATDKGHGYPPAENDPTEFHGVAPFFVESGALRRAQSDQPCGIVACRELAQLAQGDIRICGITAAMETGTGMEYFRQACPERFYDVGIAEEHAIVMAGGMAATGLKPYVAIYSTFLERGYDQMLIDICRNNLPVTFLIDRAGLVGADGETHQGLFDLSFLRTMPNMIIASPRDNRELKKMIRLSATLQAPMAIRYPKSMEDLGSGLESQKPLCVGEWELLSDGSDVMMIANGRCVQKCMQAAIELMGKGVSAGVIDARFIKPMDETLLSDVAGRIPMLVTVEENVLSGGFGEGVNRFILQNGYRCEVMNLGVGDAFIPHGSVDWQMHEIGLDAQGIGGSILERLGKGK